MFLGHRHKEPVAGGPRPAGGGEAAAVEGIGRPRSGSAKVPECPDAWNNERQTRPEPHRTVEAAS